jgi:GntR family transcriptional repressor for pyruvate dehydrogenase complex
MARSKDDAVSAASSRGAFAALAPIPRIDLTEEVIRRFKQLLAEGELKPGGRLPPERELAVLFGISRPSLRHGLKALEMIGAIDSRRRYGTFVSESAGNVLEEPLNLVVLLNSVTFEELFEVRRIVEIELAALAAARATDAELSDIQQCLKEQRMGAGTPQEFLNKDLEFHNLIARASHNSVFSVFLGSLRRLMSDKMQVLLFDAPGTDIPRNVANTIEQHGEIVQKLIARDPVGARESMLYHLEQVYTQWMKLRKHGSGARSSVDGTVQRVAAAGVSPKPLKYRSTKS